MVYQQIDFSPKMLNKGKIMSYQYRLSSFFPIKKKTNLSYKAREEHFNCSFNYTFS